MAKNLKNIREIMIIDKKLRVSKDSFCKADKELASSDRSFIYAMSLVVGFIGNAAAGVIETIINREQFIGWYNIYALIIITSFIALILLAVVYSLYCSALSIRYYKHGTKVLISDD